MNTGRTCKVHTEKERELWGEGEGKREKYRGMVTRRGKERKRDGENEEKSDREDKEGH